MSTVWKKILPKRLHQSKLWSDLRYRRNAFAALTNEFGAKNRKALWGLSSGVIQSGPFSGCYLKHVHGPLLTSKLLGIYEKELHTWIEQLKHLDVRQVLVLGGAEGYYVVGLAKLWPQARFSVWEASAYSRELLEKQVRENGLADRVELHGLCDGEAFRGEVNKRRPDFVLCDIEGGEVDLLNESNLELLLETTLLLETHESEGIGELISRIQEQFDVETKIASERTAADWASSGVPPMDSAVMSQIMDEERQASGTKDRPWILARPKQNRN